MVPFKILNQTKILQELSLVSSQRWKWIYTTATKHDILVLIRGYSKIPDDSSLPLLYESPPPSLPPSPPPMVWSWQCYQSTTEIPIIQLDISHNFHIYTCLLLQHQSDSEYSTDKWRTQTWNSSLKGSCWECIRLVIRHMCQQNVLSVTQLYAELRCIGQINVYFLIDNIIIMMYGNQGGYSRFQVTWMIEWGAEIKIKKNT